MCTQVTMKDLVTVHHEMAHLQYFLEYRQQPKVFRDGANPGMVWSRADVITRILSD
jgi:peptidyl-dipeptidase A